MDNNDVEKDKVKNEEEAVPEKPDTASEISDKDLEQITGGLDTPSGGDPWFKRRGNLTQNDLKWNNHTRIIKGDSNL